MIPKIIHYCWFGNGEIPERDKGNIKRWAELNPDYKIICWDESNYDVTKNRYMKNAYESGKLGFVPDYARTDIVYRYGGFYFDTDVEMLKPLNDLIKEKSIMGFEHRKSVNHGHGFAAEAGNPILKELLDFYESIDFIDEKGCLNEVASPVYITNLLVKHGLKLNNREQFIDGIHVFPTEYFCPKDYGTGKVCITENTYSIHHFNLSWMDSQSKHRMQETGKYSRIFGKFIGRNIVDFKYALKNKGVKGVILEAGNKIKRKFGGLTSIR